MSVDVLLFDFGGTLDADGVRWSERFHECYRTAGGTLALAAFDRRFRDSDRLLARHPAIRSLGFRQTVRLQAEFLEDLAPDGSLLDWDEIAFGFIQETIRIVERNRPLLAEWSNRFQLGVVSNFTGNLRPCLEELHLAEHFQILLDSTVEGWAKPDPRLFEAALEALHCPVARACVIGDNPEADIRPALELGASAVWLAPAERPDLPDCRPTFRIAALPELAALEVACTD